VQTKLVYQPDVSRFFKNNSDSSLEWLHVIRVESIGKKADSNRVFTITFLSVTQVESSHPKSWRSQITKTRHSWNFRIV